MTRSSAMYLAGLDSVIGIVPTGCRASYRKGPTVTDRTDWAGQFIWACNVAAWNNALNAGVGEWGNESPTTSPGHNIHVGIDRDIVGPRTVPAVGGKQSLALWPWTKPAAQAHP